MILKVSVPSRFQFKTRPSFCTMLMQREGEIHYIGGADILPAPLDGEAEQELIGRLGGPEEKEARSRLIEHNLRLVAHIIKKYYSTYRDQEDLISIGTIGLIKAVSSFDYTKGTKFATYASRCIENEILMHFRNKKKSMHDVYLSDSIDTDKDGNAITLIDIMPDETNILDSIDLNIQSHKMYQLIQANLSEREKKILTMRYGLYGTRPLTQREVAKKLDISRSYVSRIEKKALEELRRQFGE